MSEPAWHPPAQPNQPNQPQPMPPYAPQPMPPYPPQPYPPYQGHGYVPASLRSVRGLSYAVIALAVAFTATALVSAAAAPAAANGSSSAEAINLGFTVLGLPLQLALVGVVGTWLFQIRENAEAVGPGSQRRSVAWCWLGWFIPIVCYWFPYMVVRDLCTSTGFYARGRNVKLPPLGMWWTVWVISVVVSGAYNGATMSASTFTSGHAVVEIIIAALLLAGLPLWLSVVRWLTAVQDDLRAAGQSAFGAANGQAGPVGG